MASLEGRAEEAPGPGKSLGWLIFVSRPLGFDRHEYSRLAYGSRSAPRCRTTRGNRSCRRATCSSLYRSSQYARVSADLSRCLPIAGIPSSCAAPSRAARRQPSGAAVRVADARTGSSRHRSSRSTQLLMRDARGPGDSTKEEPELAPSPDSLSACAGSRCSNALRSPPSAVFRLPWRARESCYEMAAEIAMTANVPTATAITVRSPRFANGLPDARQVWSPRSPVLSRRRHNLFWYFS